MIVACVRNGPKYGPEYVYKLRSMVRRHLKVPHRFVCLTDRPMEIPGVVCSDISTYGLPGWFAKMALFEPEWRSREPVLYFDLDTVICDDISALGLDIEFGICANFTRRAGFKTPCAYGSCVMSIGPDRCADIWTGFRADPQHWMDRAGNLGDQWIIEKLMPAATLLQDAMPEGFFLGYRDLTETKPAGCSVVIFAGRSKPHNCNEEWIQREWIP